MIELKEGDYIIGLWYVAYDGGDWLLCIKRDEGAKHPVIQMRFRKRVDEEIWQSNDEKHWYQAVIPEDHEPYTDEEHIQKADLLQEKMAETRREMFGEDDVYVVDKIIVQGGPEKLMEVARSAKKEWFNFAEARGGDKPSEN